MFEKVLIANRGEIAVRVIRACRELGIRSVAVYSDADRDALHVRSADEAFPCGPPPARESYLVGERMVEIARRAGAGAIHPGYGFLSERGEFADLCRDARIAFIGPSGDVIRSMGDKVRAREIARRAGLPVVPGSDGCLSDAEAREWVRAHGVPVLVKAAAGGGGRGMRLVSDAAKLPEALKRARGEARSAFGDDSLYLEKRIDQPRHVEVQILADAAGRTVHLFERECSIQRRHQKLVEEAPANRVDAAQRARMCESAVALARAVGYVGAGTCEFLVDARGEFYFLEMNTRIQVEHPITEAVTGFDLVQAMIRIAAGEPLGVRQDALALRGHAIEARLYAEDPARNFLPSPGRITRWRPPEGPGIRVDSGVAEGAAVTVHYDPMLAKLIAWGADREQAMARLEGALGAFEIEGIRTTLPFHLEVVRDAGFRAGRYDTGFVEARRAGARA